MSALLDVNVLVSLAWPNHVHHSISRRWFAASAVEGWATSPLTQSGFVRVSSNRRVIPEARSVHESAAVLRRLCEYDGHEFWTDDVALTRPTAVGLDDLTGYRQVTDAHLLELAARRGGRLLTFDRAVSELGRRHAVEVELLT